MFNRLKNRVLTVVSPEVAMIQAPQGHPDHHGKGHQRLPDKFTYARPCFLQLSSHDELKASADHNVRPIIVPRDISALPWTTGYAECVNSGKSEWNEDQAAFQRQILSHPSKQFPDLPYTYFGIFDGHAGYGAALAAANQFHHILHEKLVDVLDLLMPRLPATSETVLPHSLLFHRSVSKDELIIGALESAFAEMDAVLAEDRNKYRNAGGCTALAALFIFGKMFVANAGDSRAVLCQRVSTDLLKAQIVPHELKGAQIETGEENKTFRIFPIPFSHDHTPDTERSRLLSTAKLNPSFMGGEYIAMEYAKKPMTKDLGTRILYRQGTMKGWAYKTLTREDLKMPIVTGEGKRSRLLGTIGVTRGFGDHDLRAIGSNQPIKPFLSPHPEVTYRDLTKVISIPGDDNEDGDYGILVMATDGLWDVADSETVSRTVFQTLGKYPTEKHRYTMVAQELVAKSRGRVNESGHWRLADSKAAATVDDISVLVIPVYQYYVEFLEWEKACFERERAQEAKIPLTDTDTEESSNDVDLNGFFENGKEEETVQEHTNGQTLDKLDTFVEEAIEAQSTT
ncbi:protein phosphatase 1H isoform X1 [Phlebotomus papatasi]|uniref:protein phosphatase 1H isoform X1 n=1 Tax=Phlebotomus papatasi TaxID=29031 RepID=UPI0024837C0C|nr:protein phosphatase 1H isoform X1 [Phlebotomus papatasi]